MFPSADEPTATATVNRDHSSPHKSELSPPSSQEPHTNLGPAIAGHSGEIGEGGGRNGTSHNEPVAEHPEKADGEAENEPGWAWKNNRAMEEYQSCMELVQDPGFNLRMNQRMAFAPHY